MQSVAVTFNLEFPARRQLQSSTSVDPTSPVFQQRLKSSVAAALGSNLGEQHILITSESSNPRILTVTVIGFYQSEVTPTTVLNTVSSLSFVLEIGNALGVSVLMSGVPAIAMRTTDVPSPPPAAPPEPPSTPSTPATPIGAGLSQVQNQDTSRIAGELSQEMIWVIIATVIVVLLVMGCVAVYYIGKCSNRKTTLVRIGRPGLRRQVSPDEQQHRSNTLVAQAELDQPQGDSEAVNVRVEDVRLIQLGMAVERTVRGGAGSSGHGGASAEDIAIKLDNAQAALEDLRESISPRSPRSVPRFDSMPRSPHSPRTPDRQVVDTRIPKDVVNNKV